MNTYPDETLEYWGDRFVASGLRVVTTFEDFMQMSPPLRNRRLVQCAQVRVLQERIERRLPDAGLRDSVLVDPIHHGKRVNRKPWWFRAYRGRGRK